MNKKISLGLCISLMAIAAAITFIIATSYTMSLYNGLVADVQQRAEMYTKLEQIDTYVRAYYNGAINEDELIESLANAYISVLGNNLAQYYDANEYTLYKEHLSGTHQGVGIYFEEAGGCPCVTDVLANSPAASAGINIGDSIVAINSQSVLEMGYDKAYSLLTSEAGTQLSLTLRSKGEDRNVNVSTVQMTVASVSADSFDGYGYIRVYEFSEKTYRQFIAAYSMLMSSDIKGIIIDLRNNSGVIYEPVFNLLNVLLPEGSVPYVSVDHDGKEAAADPANGSNSPSVPISVIVNSRTSGPAELFAAAIRDGLGSSIVGTTTVGNAQLFETFGLYDSTAISLPTATLNSEKTSFAGVGVKPDFEVVVSNDTNNDLIASGSSDACIKKAAEILSQAAH